MHVSILFQYELERWVVCELILNPSKWYKRLRNKNLKTSWDPLNGLLSKSLCPPLEPAAINLAVAFRTRTPKNMGRQLVVATEKGRLVPDASQRGQHHWKEARKWLVTPSVLGNLINRFQASIWERRFLESRTSFSACSISSNSAVIAPKHPCTGRVPGWMGKVRGRGLSYLLMDQAHRVSGRIERGRVTTASE